ncbi:HD domain-containing protein [Sphingosinicella humi]|uniref:Phosphohydrolase n=1 Tax=Allosphingosinicella humi TaxID=2068657 RepID=A0A2U2J573_9SPHN|nr:HD domain-containing protein [Sphingosinicella humi]PWG03488.1 phosphohydrolase [Sphingosinicella humi]
MSADLGLILRAAHFAAQRHSTQRRKDAAASPYINHPLAVAAILAEEGGITDSVTIVAALLHDVVEDTVTTPDEVHEHFGGEVASVVAEVTDDKKLEPAERKRLQIQKASSKSERAKLVKMADKIANLRDLVSCPPPDWDHQRRCDYFEWAHQVVEGLRGVSRPLEEAFDRAYELRPA